LVYLRLRKLYPFLIVFAIELIFIFYLIISHRGVIGHDAFQYFSLQYYFLNNAVNAGETAQWMPFVTHGTVSNWWYGVQSGIVQSAMLSFGRLNTGLLGRNFLPIFYIGILFDVTVFLLGIWLIGQRYFKSNLTILFVAITGLGSAGWFTQPWYNLHSYFALLLILHFIHCLFESGRWRYFLFAGNLFAIQCCGSLPYLLPLSALVICSYTSFYLLFFWKRTKWEAVRLFRNWKNAILPVLLVSLSLYLVVGMLTYGTAEIANYNVGRTLDGKSVSLQAFLGYGTNSNLRWAELVTRISPAWDYNLYFGYLALVFAGLAFSARPSKTFLVVACTTVMLFLIANATPLASFFYYVWPGMDYFRHLSLASTLVRMFLGLVSGFGFERIMIFPSRDRDHSRLRIAVLLTTAAAIGLLIVSHFYEFSRNWVQVAVSGSLPNDTRFFEKSYLLTELFKASLWCFGAALILVMCVRAKTITKWLIIGAIVFQTLDIYSFKWGLANLRTIPLSQEQYDISRFQKAPYSVRRAPVDYQTHPRGKYVPQNDYGAVYWTADSYMFIDPPSNLGRTDHWLRPFDDFLRTYSGERIRDFAHKPAVFQVYGPIKFPLNEPNAQKLAGITADKIQFFSKASLLSNDETISKIMASQSFTGDDLLLSDSSDGSPDTSGVGARLQRRYEVLSYDSNNILILVTDANAGDWLYYADCWHPFWHAIVNGREVRDYKANLAYKAVRLDQGENLVHFRFQSTRLFVFMTGLNWNGLIWVAGVLYLIVAQSLHPRNLPLLEPELFGKSTMFGLRPDHPDRAPALRAAGAASPPHEEGS
jgi:hypothetical protein